LNNFKSREAQSACADLIAAFAHYVDHRLFADAVALFKADGCFERPDLTATGHAEIASIWANRPISVVTRHLCSQPFFTQVREDFIMSVTSFTLYYSEHAREGLPQCDRFTAIAEFSDRFELTQEVWRIAHRRATPIILGPRP
jgi:3-phenylpropionate/cinnamic acid dioxygenase small subunit